MKKQEQKWKKGYRASADSLLFYMKKQERETEGRIPYIEKTRISTQYQKKLANTVLISNISGYKRSTICN